MEQDTLRYQHDMERNIETTINHAYNETNHVPHPQYYLKNAEGNEEPTIPLLSNSTDSTKSPYDQPLIFRIAILLCVSFLSFGSYFAYDAVSALEVHIKKDLDLDGFKFGLLSSVYSFPNIGMVLVGGLIIDKMGNRFSTILFCSLFTLGAGIVALSAYSRSFHLMLFGRFIFGLGAESSYVVQNNICIEWFTSWKYFALAMGITLTIARLGTIGAMTTETSIAEYFGSYTIALWFAFFFCLLSLGMGFAFVGLDKWAKKKSGYRKDVAKTNQKCISLKSFSVSYWIWVLIAVTIYSTIFPFLSMSSQYISEKWHISTTKSNFWLGFIDLTSLVLSPVFGWLVDFTGKRGLLVICGNLLAVAGYTLLGLTHLYPILPIGLLGCHFALMPAALWPSLPFLVEEGHSGFAFAIVSSLINASLTGVNPLAGYVADKTNFTWLCLFFGGISLFSFVLAVIWNVLDFFQPLSMLNKKVSKKEESIVTDVL